MKEITSKKNGQTQIIDDETWDNIVKRGWAVKFDMKPIIERKLNIPIIEKPIEIKTKTKKKV